MKHKITYIAPSENFEVALSGDVFSYKFMYVKLGVNISKQISAFSTDIGETPSVLSSEERFEWRAE